MNVSTQATSSSFTWNFSEQRPGQLMAQWPQVVVSCASAKAASGAKPNMASALAAVPAAAASAPRAPVVFRNERRLTACVFVDMSPPFSNSFESLRSAPAAVVPAAANVSHGRGSAAARRFETASEYAPERFERCHIQRVI